MSDVKNKLIKIAYENPELRDDLLSVIQKIASTPGGTYPPPNPLAHLTMAIPSRGDVGDEQIKTMLQAGANSYDKEIPEAILNMLVKRIRAKGPKNLKWYAYAVGKNTAIDTIRHEKRVERNAERERVNAIEAQKAAERAEQGVLQLVRAIEIIRSNHPRPTLEYMIEAFEEYVLNGASPAAIAKAQGTNEALIYQRVRRAKVLLAKYVGEAGKEIISDRTWGNGTRLS